MRVVATALLMVLVAVPAMCDSDSVTLTTEFSSGMLVVDSGGAITLENQWGYSDYCADEDAVIAELREKLRILEEATGMKVVERPRYEVVPSDVE